MGDGWEEGMEGEPVQPTYSEEAASQQGVEASSTASKSGADSSAADESPLALQEARKCTTQAGVDEQERSPVSNDMRRPARIRARTRSLREESRQAVRQARGLHA